MDNSTLISAPSEIDKNKLQGAIDEALAPHRSGSTSEAVSDSMQGITERIQQGEFGLPAPPKQTFDVTFTVGQNDIMEAPDWHVNFTWHWG